jgi:myo-inositol-1(or 4)-monophosphatase
VKISNQKALAAAVAAARAAGKLMRQNLRAKKTINSQSQHDIKLELDVRCQKLIEKMLARAFPQISVLGEEGESGDAQSEHRWVIDPIDGTVNFSYEIPHACVSIALQNRVQSLKVLAHGHKVQSHPDAAYETIVGVVYDPFCDELWTAVRGQAAKLNGKIIRASKRNRLENSIISVGFGKSKMSVNSGLQFFNRLLKRIRKVRMMGSAALALVYVASGRLDAYVESHISLWDIAAGGLILECAGGEFWNRSIEGEHQYRILANNGLLRRQMEKLR